MFDRFKRNLKLLAVHKQWEMEFRSRNLRISKISLMESPAREKLREL